MMTEFERELLKVEKKRNHLLDQLLKIEREKIMQKVKKDIPNEIKEEEFDES